MSNAQQPAYKIKIVDCKLFVRKAKISPSVYLAHAKALELGNAKYPLRRVICKTLTIPRGNLDFSQENVFSGQLPTRVVIGLVDNDAYNGTFTKKPFNFKHMNLTQIRVFLDGQNQGVKPIECSYNTHQYVTAYMSLFTATGKNGKDEGNDITRRDYPGGYALYAFDLTPDLSEDDHFNLNKEGSLRIDMKFAVALAATVNVILYAEFENIIEVDRNKNIIFDYQN